MKCGNRLITSKSQLFLFKVVFQSYDTNEIHCALFHVKKMFISSSYINFILKAKHKKKIKTQSYIGHCFQLGSFQVHFKISSIAYK